MLIDSHVHLDDPRYDSDRGTILSRGQEAGVGAFVTIGCDLATSRAAVALADTHSNVYATVGVHPHEVKHIENGWYEELKRLAAHPKVVWIWRNRIGLSLRLFPSRGSTPTIP